MPTASSVLVDPGTTTPLASYSFAESAVTKQLSRATLNDSSGAETGVTANPFYTTGNHIGTNGSALPSKVAVVAGSDGTNAVALSINSSFGGLEITPANPSTNFNNPWPIYQDRGQSIVSSAGAGNRSAVMTIGGFFDDTTSYTVSTAGIGMSRITSARALHTNLRNNSGTEIGTTTTPIQVVVKDDTSSVFNGSTSLTPKFAAINASASGNNTIVGAVASKKIRVLALSITGLTAVNAKFQSGASGTDLTGLYHLGATGGMVLPYNPVGWFETASSALLNLNLDSAVNCGGSITYIEV